MLADEKKLQNIHVRMVEGTIYTVDEVSGLLGIPRPTLYRYLREYSIPHLRQAGRISIPEDSFDRIREARDLHKEGLGTGSSGGSCAKEAPPMRGTSIAASIISTGAWMTCGGHQRASVAEEVALSPPCEPSWPARASSCQRCSTSPRWSKTCCSPAVSQGGPSSTTSQRGRRCRKPQARDRLEVATATLPGPDQDSAGLTLAARSADFGALRKRRRRAVLAILVALLFAVSLAWSIQALFYTSNAEPWVPRLTATSDEPPGAPKAIAAVGGSGLKGETKVPDVSGRSLEEAVSSFRRRLRGS